MRNTVPDKRLLRAIVHFAGTIRDMLGQVAAGVSSSEADEEGVWPAAGSGGRVMVDRTPEEFRAVVSRPTTERMDPALSE